MIPIFFDFWKCIFMKIAITGAGGFLGTELLKQLSAHKEVTVYAFTFDFERNRSTYISSDNIITLDNSDAAGFDYSSVDVLINCAFPRNVENADFAKGLDFIQRVIEKAAKDNVGSVINISSQSVYDPARTQPADENSAIILETKYAVGKYWSELFVNSMSRNIRHTNLRMASLIGPGFDQRITNKFAKKVIDGEQITVIGGDQLFGYLDVRDAASGIITVALSEGNWEEVYNLGTESAYTLEQIAQTAVQVGREIGFDANNVIVADKEPGSYRNSSISCDRFKQRFASEFDYDLNTSIIDIFELLRRNEK